MATSEELNKLYEGLREKAKDYLKYKDKLKSLGFIIDDNNLSTILISGGPTADKKPLPPSTTQDKGDKDAGKDKSSN